MSQIILKNSIKAWFLAARPKTLSAALIPVITASALAFSHQKLQIIPTVLCMCFALFMQIAANFINDLFDYKKGTDGAERLGPERACAQGWISPEKMKVGISITLFIACAFGVGLLCFGGWELILVGVACVIFAFLYTTLLSYMGCGDILVYVFFGIVPVAGTYYLQAHQFTPQMWWLCAAIGLSTDNLLVLNNYRDRTTDSKSGKRTLVVALGETFGQQFYLWQGVAAAMCACVVLGMARTWWMPFICIYLSQHILTWINMVKINEGRALNKILGRTSLNMLILGMTLTICLLLS